MLEKLEKLNTEWSKNGWPHISIGIGINTGEAIVGNMGANVRFDYTAIGDTVNLASRLEGLNKIYGTEIILSKSTLDSIESAEPAFLVRELDLVQVKGKEKPIPIFELIDFYPGSLKQRTLVKFFSEALYLFRERSFQKARDKFADIMGTFPDDKPSSLYFERCSQYIAQPPPVEWEGIYIAKEK
jgi:adenylate cyclase